jgi:hypothetical protein
LNALAEDPGYGEANLLEEVEIAGASRTHELLKAVAASLCF